MTFARRHLIMGGLSLAAAGGAFALMPRRKLRLLQGATIEKVLPVDVGRWRATTSPGLVSPEQAGKLARTLYSEIVELTFHDRETGAGIMMLAAYGDTQSDLLQLHRPEVCYPAVGFDLKASDAATLPLAPHAALPIRKVVAQMQDRLENIVYWTRLGEKLPQSDREQRKARFENALDGFVADGILVRTSIVGPTDLCFKILDEFVPALLKTVAKPYRPALIGTQLARAMTA